ncbi:MAG: ABC transporter ATP-binding protein [Verrucomicrobiota bacterium]
MSSENAIQVQHLYRYFGNLKAVDGVSFSVRKGEVVGFIGANGAGKTTTMRILATLDFPSAGEVSVHGINVINYPMEVRQHIGWMPDHFGTYDNMTILEYLDFYARALGYKGDERVARINDVMDFTDLTSISDRLMNKLSKGMGQRLCLGRALIHDPDVLIMDEPAAGLDPRARVELKRLIRILSEEGKTIFISSHILGELQEMCDSLLFINAGKIIHQGQADELLQVTGETAIMDVQLLERDTSKLSDWAITTPNVNLVEETRMGGKLEIKDASEEKIASVLKSMLANGLQVIDFHREQKRLEDAFIEILGKAEQNQTRVLPAAPPPITVPPMVSPASPTTPPPAQTTTPPHG